MPDPRDRDREFPRRPRQDRNSGTGGPAPQEGNPNAPLKYDLEEIERRRNWVGEQIWRAVAAGQLNLNNRDQISRFLNNLRPAWFGGVHGIRDKKEEGRHMRKLFLGDLGEEGWGGDRALQEYKPNWRRMVEGMNRDPKSGLYGTDGGKWYDAFGRLVRTDPISPPVPPPPPPPPPPEEPPPNENQVFYGGSNAPNPYGTEPPNGMNGQQQQRPNGGNNKVQAPAWYSTWRF